MFSVKLHQFVWFDLLLLDSSDPYLGSPVIVHTIPGNKSVAGITVLENELVVAREQIPNLETYDIHDRTAIVQRRILVPGLRRPSDIAALPVNKLICIADAVGTVYVIDSSGKIQQRFQVDTWHEF